MVVRIIKAVGLAMVLAAPLVGCSKGSGSLGSFGGRLFGGAGPANTAPSEDILPANATDGTPPPAQSLLTPEPARRGLFGRRSADPAADIQVNKFIWAAALDVLNFLPVRSADPFTGVIVTGYGTPPGGGRAYRATIFVQEATLDAGSLHVALLSRGGPASDETIRAVEDAILTRARQLRLGG